MSIDRHTIERLGRACPTEVGSLQLHTVYSDAVHEPIVAVIVVDGAMPDAAIVPQGCGAAKVCGCNGAVCRIGRTSTTARARERERERERASERTSEGASEQASERVSATE